MNMHMAQNPLAETELRLLASTWTQIMSPSSNVPIISIYQDSLLGSYRFTRDVIQFSPRDAMNLLMGFNKVNPAKLFPDGNVKQITNFEILSQILPPLTLKYKTKLWDADKQEDPAISNNILEIVNGEYVRGQIEKSVFGGASKGIVHRICNDYGKDAAADFIDNLQSIVTEYMKVSSYSVGVSDLMSNRETNEGIIHAIQEKEMEVAQLIQRLHAGIFENNTSYSNKTEFENQVNNVLNDATKRTDEISRKSLNPENRFLKIVESGSKGSLINISHMISCLGQVNVDSKRVPYGFEGRTLPHFTKFDDSPSARGFIKNSYIGGLNAHELFFHAMGGRIGLIDTAVKSVSWETPIVIVDSDKPVYTEIGRWVDAIIDQSENVQRFEEKNMELVNLAWNSAFIPTMDENGVVSWEEVTAVTRHDPGNVLYKIKSMSGRSVVVTESKSLLIWNKDTEKFNEVLTPEIQLGDCLPVTADLQDFGDCFGNAHEFVRNCYKNHGESGSLETATEQEAHLAAMAFNRTGQFVELDGCRVVFDVESGKYKRHNDVVLDPIVSIEPLSPDNYPKMYDLTIPKTLNFGLANGLQVRDTSQTGYLQRRLIKGLEDLKVEYDMTVRNSHGKVIQFSYGDDSFDPMFVENQAIPLVGMTVEDIYARFDMSTPTLKKDDPESIIFVSTTLSRMKKQEADLKKRCKESIDQAITDRDLAVTSVFRNKNTDSVLAPVAFMHIINNIQGNLGLAANSLVDITPLEAFELIDEYFAKLEAITFAKPNRLFRMLYYYYLNPRELLFFKRFHKAGLVLLLETVYLKYKQALVNPGEMVGVVAGQSIGEPTTQLTLNSVTYETEILVRNTDGFIRSVQIGDFVKEGVDQSSKVTYMQDKDTTYAELSDFYEVPCATKGGETVWRRIEAVTKHPVVNEDGTNTMVKVTTKGNREMIATKAKSFLCLQNGEITEINGSLLRVGMFLPASRKPLEFTETFRLDLRKILPPTEYIYGTEMEKAKSVVDERQWWSKYSGKLFVIPYKRSDSAYCVLKGTQRAASGHTEYKPGCVYTTTNNICNYEIPEYIPMDYDFGYLVGAYCAEGCMTSHQVSIANNDLKYFDRIESWCARHNLTTKVYRHENKIQEGWTSQDIRIYSTILCRILEKLCGKLSHNKFISDLILFSNRECLLGFLDAYISGNGSVQGTDERVSAISMYSVSLKLLSQVQLILRNLGIVGKINKPPKQMTNNRGSVDIKQLYNLAVPNEQSQKLGRLLNLSISRKQELLSVLAGQTFKYEYWKTDLEVPNLVDGELVMEPRDGRYLDLEFDEIVSIEEVSNTTDYAYDLTVEDTRNFDLANGLCAADTFHNAGVASKSNVTRGVPRIDELLRLTKTPKNPSMTVFLKSHDESNQDKAKQFANMMEHTKLSNVVNTVEICFDPSDENTRIQEDRDLLERYYAFTKMVEKCNQPDNLEDIPADGPKKTKSKWVVRMEMNTETMLDKNITMDDIHFAVKNGVNGNDIDCVYSDFNADKLVFRIRMTAVSATKGRKKTSAPESLDQTDEIYVLKRFQDDLLNYTVLRGVSGIQNVIPRKLNNMVSKIDGNYSKKDTWILDTTGSNLLDTLGLDYIDATRTFSNHIREMFDVLGIEAARQIIHDEIVDVLEFSGAYANYHHLGLLCDRMTTNKDMVSIFRTGLFSDNIGPIAKSTFEVHTEVLLDAARFGEADNMRGVSANVMCGQPGYYGTNAFQLVLDMEAMKELSANIVSVSKRKRNLLEDVTGVSLDDNSNCATSRVFIPSNISAVTKVPADLGFCVDGYDAGF